MDAVTCFFFTCEIVNVTGTAGKQALKQAASCPNPTDDRRDILGNGRDECVHCGTKNSCAQCIT